MDGIKMAPCRCGGRPTLYQAQIMIDDKKEYYSVACKKCGIGTDWSSDSNQALNDWNNVMSGKPSKALYIEDVQKYICEECGASINIGDRYCHNCGYKLIWKRGIKINDSQND